MHDRLQQMINKRFDSGSGQPTASWYYYGGDKSAVTNIAKGKARGQDGFTIEIYQVKWKTMKQDVIEATKFSFNQNYMYYPINSTTLTLVRKLKMHLQWRNIDQ